jgi:hypothetical protein
VVVVDESDLHKSLDVLRSGGHQPRKIGTIAPGKGTVQIVAR